MIESNNWFYKHSPKTLKEMCLTSKQRAIFQKYIDEKKVPHLILYGHPGIGKTTFYYVLKNELQATGEMFDGSTNRSINLLREDISNILSKVCFSDTYEKRLLFLDEFENISKDFMLALKGTIDYFDSNATFIFATNTISDVTEALLERCELINLIPNSLEEKKELMIEYGRRALEILEIEKVKYDIDTFKIILKRCYPSMRNFIKVLQSTHLKYGKISKEVLDDESIFAVDKIIKFLSSDTIHNWESMKKLVDNMQQPETIYSDIYDKITPLLKKDALRPVTKVVAEHSFRVFFSKNKSIMVTAFLTELMECTRNKWLSNKEEKNKIIF